MCDNHQDDRLKNRNENRETGNEAQNVQGKNRKQKDCQQPQNQTGR